MDIKVTGAKEHNLKDINLEIPRNKLTSVVGVSGSGKSTIAFDIVFAEGQRQYLESLSAYARQFLQRSNRPDIDSVVGLSPTIVIEQKVVRGNPRSTVGTVTELYNYLRLLYSRVGLPTLSASHFSFNNPLGACPGCKGLGRQLLVKPERVLDFNRSLNEGAILHRTWKVGSMYWKIIRNSGYFDMNKKIKDYTKKELDLLLYSPPAQLEDKKDHPVSFTYEGIIGRLIKRNSSRHRPMKKYDIPYFEAEPCGECNGGRLNKKTLSILVKGKNIGETANMQLTDLLVFVKKIKHPHAKPITPRMTELLEYLINSGVGYLSLNRSVGTLSGGEAQRIKFAKQLASDLIETIYILDEPTVGLHPRDINKLIKNLKQLRDKQNTVIVVEHEPSVILASDYVIEIGPGAGRFGGEITAKGSPRDIVDNRKSITGLYLNGKKSVAQKSRKRKAQGYLKLKNASLNNLKKVTVKIPTGVFVAITGVSGAGKSSLVDVLAKKYQENIILIDKSPIGRMARSNPATYTGAFDFIREIFAKTNKVNKSLFSSNSKGACSKCKGLGYRKMDMQFLGDIKIICDACGGRKYISEVLKYKVRDKNIFDILQMTVEEANVFFRDKEIGKRLSLLIDVGLDYLELGQTSDTLSGGEAQRLKLAKKLNEKGEFYILDEPTKGLHLADIEKLLTLLNRLVDNGNSVLIVEHNLDIIKSADWIIDLGPEGGNRGGEIIAEGTPDQVAKIKRSYTGRYLRTVIS